MPNCCYLSIIFENWTMQTDIPIWSFFLARHNRMRYRSNSWLQHDLPLPRTEDDTNQAEWALFLDKIRQSAFVFALEAYPRLLSDLIDLNETRWKLPLPVKLMLRQRRARRSIVSTSCSVWYGPTVSISLLWGNLW